MEVKFWGVRGSIPHSLDTESWVEHFKRMMLDFFEHGYKNKSDIETYLNQMPKTSVGGFGTATTCVEVTSEGRSIIIDGGTGIKSKSDFYERLNLSERPKEFHILISHFHFDHIMGLPFFMPHFIKGCKINYYSVQDETEKVIRGLFKKPTFPVTFENLQAEIVFHKLAPQKINVVNGFNVSPYLMDHPDPCYGFKIESNSKAYAHAVDTEGIRRTKASLDVDAPLFENVDLVYFDAQYDEVDMMRKKGWGHGTCDRGFEICSNFGIKQILFAHHDPAFSIKDSWEQKKRAEIISKEKFPDLKVNWDFAYDGLKVKI